MDIRRSVRPLAAGSLVIVLGLAAAACGGSAVPSVGAPLAGSARGGAGTALPAAGVPAKSEPSTVAVPMPPPAAEGSKVIRSGQVGLEVKTGSFDAAYARVVEIAGEEGGVVSASSASADGERIRAGSITLSVPSANFQATLDRLRQVGSLKGLAVTSQDVSQQYVDLKARLANAQAERDAMLALLQRAQTVQDILAVQNQLGQYQQQVEQLQGQIDYYDHATAMSSIQVSLREAGAAAPAVDQWGLVSAFWNGLHALVQTFSALLFVLVVAGPYLLLAGLGWIAWKRRRRTPARAV